MPPAKNPTYWNPSNGKGQVLNIGNFFLADQTGNFLIDQSKNFLIGTPTIVTGLNQTAWTETLPS